MERDDPIEAPRVRRGDRAPGEPRNVAWLYLLPGLAFYLLFTLGPLLHTAWLSLFDWDGLTAGRYIGLANYREALGDPLVHDAFRHSAELVVFYALLPIAIGLLLTAMLTRRPVRGFAGFRAVLFLPQMIAGVVVAQAWVWIYAEQGPLNEFLRTIGLGSLARPWLGSFTWALPAIGVIGTWVTYGLCMVLFVAGVQKIPSSLYDAARVDGAGPVREFFAVTLPGLRNEIVVALRADHDQRPAQLRRHLQHEPGRPRHADVRAVALRLPERVRLQPGRLRRGDRRAPGSAILAVALLVIRLGGGDRR